MTFTPHRFSKQYPWVFKCDNPACDLIVAAKEQVPVRHPCPYRGGVTKIAWSITVTLVEKAWAILDSHMDELALMPEDEDPELRATLKGKCRGVAEILAIFMHPHFEDANEIAREAKRRADARARQDAEYETRGLKSLRYAPPPSEDMDKYKREPKKKADNPLVTPEDAQKIRLAFGSFPTDMLAQAYGLTEQQVEEIAKSPAPEPELSA